jgi:serine/threonine protein phosphatase PrpC
MSDNSVTCCQIWSDNRIVNDFLDVWRLTISLFSVSIIFGLKAEKIIETLKRLIVNLQTSRKSLTILLSDHIWQHVTELSDIVHILSDGEIIRSLKPADVVKDERARSEYFGNI